MQSRENIMTTRNWYWQKKTRILSTLRRPATSCVAEFESDMCFTNYDYDFIMARANTGDNTKKKTSLIRFFFLRRISNETHCIVWKLTNVHTDTVIKSDKSSIGNVWIWIHVSCNECPTGFTYLLIAFYQCGSARNNYYRAVGRNVHDRAYKRRNVASTPIVATIILY